jgi:hypothetical protein
LKDKTLPQKDFIDESPNQQANTAALAKFMTELDSKFTD